MVYFVKTCFIIDLLRQIVMSSIISFFMGFHINSSDDKIRSDKVIKSINLSSRILNVFGLLNIYVLNRFFYY